ncbi:DUF222 domain-containing protein, partial [Nocardioides albidus]|uniref:DUF222 domain-containing protein n=1 Tax=Nocardioides albidus TaxID=1517589 RepID=UPI0013052AD7
RVITDAIHDLPADLGPDLAASAEETLVEHAAHHQPRELKRLGQRILDVVAPDIAEAEEGRRLGDEERRAREKASLRFRDLGDGRTRISGTLPTTVAQRLIHYLQAYTSPRKRLDTPSPGGAGYSTNSGVPQHRAYAEAFAALLELLDPDRLPEHGG